MFKMSSNSWCWVVSVTVALLALIGCVTSMPPYDFDALRDTDKYFPEVDDTSYSVEKRGGGLRPVPFPCNGYDNVPRCLHGGKGPRKTWTKSGRFCVCLCPSKWVGPECGYAADSLPGKRTFPWKVMADVERRSAAAPWRPY